MKNLTVLVKVSGECPLNCVYCYAGNASHEIMNFDTLESMISILETRKNRGQTTYVWHGKEPLTAGLDFYRRVRYIQKMYDNSNRIMNCMQTSGVLLDKEYIEFLAREDFELGFSLDGPQWLHNKIRMYKNGEGSFRDTMNAISMWRNTGKDPGIVAVITKLSLPALDEMYDFFKAEKLDFKINPIIPSGNNADADRLVLTPDETYKALSHLFDRWFYDIDTKSPIKYVNMYLLVESMISGKHRSCDLSPNCQNSLITICSDGSVVPCTRFNNTKYTYGNITSVASFEEILDNEIRQLLLTRQEQIESCIKCTYYSICYSGCMHNSYLQGNILGKDPNCRILKQMFEYVAKAIVSNIGHRQDKPEVQNGADFQEAQ